MKSVPNLISYRHKFLCNFPQLLAICFELFLFRIVFNSEIIYRRVPPVSLSLSAPGPLISKSSPRGCHALALCFKGAILTAPCARPIHAAVSEAAAAPLPTTRVRARHAAIAFAASARVSAPRHRVFTPSRPRSPLFHRHVLWLPATSPLLRLPA
jgi:hypothetical protein